MIGVLRRDRREPRPLRAIALPGAPEDGDEPARRERAQEREDLLQRFGRVGVVDDDAERLAGVDTVHAPAHGTRAEQGLAALREGRSGGEAGARRGERVVHVEATDERQP